MKLRSSTGHGKCRHRSHAVSLGFPRGYPIAGGQHHGRFFHADASLAGGVCQLPVGEPLPLEQSAQDLPENVYWE